MFKKCSIWRNKPFTTFLAADGTRKIAHNVPVFFFFPEKMKSARETIFWHFFLFFSRVENIFLAHFYLNFLGHSEVFSGRFSDFFSGLWFFFSGRNFRISRYFLDFDGENIDFFSRAKIFFSRVEFFCFFLGHIFFLWLFSRFFSRPVSKLLGQNIENFLGFNFFFLGEENKHWVQCLRY